MKQISFAVLFVATIAYCNAAAVAQKSEERYTTKYNNFDVDSVLNNTKILKSYIRCVLGEGPCTNEGRELAKVVPDAIKTECSKCDEKQKASSIKVMKHLDKHHPDLLEKLIRKFDPKGEHEKKLREQIRKAEATPAATSTTLPTKVDPKPVTKLETKVDSKPTPVRTETKVDSKPAPTKIETTKTESKPQTITKLEARPAAEKPKPPTETKKTQTM